MKKIKLYIVDDHRMILDMWATLLAANPRFEVVGTSLDAETAIHEISFKPPDVLLLDISLPGTSGIALTKQLKEKHPAIKILGVSMHTHIILIKQLLISGASGYVSMTSSFDEMITAIIAVYEGNRYICRDSKDYITNQVISEQQTDPVYRINQLTRRELEIVNLIKEGHSSNEISDKLLLSKRTVEVHRYNIFRKLGVNNIISLISVLNKSIV